MDLEILEIIAAVSGIQSGVLVQERSGIGKTNERFRGCFQSNVSGHILRKKYNLDKGEL